MDDRAVASEPRTRRHPDDVRRMFETGLRELGPEPDAQDALAWAADAFGHRLAVASSMSDTVVAHLASQFVPDVHVVFLDTGLHFAETLAYRDQLHRELPITVVSARPALTVEQQAEQYGAELHRTDPAACCRMRKVDVMDDALRPYEAWVTGLRRVDSETRRDDRGARVGRASRHGEAQPDRGLVRRRRRGVRRASRPARASAAPGRLPLDRVRALHAGRGARGVAACGSMGGHGQDRVRPARRSRRAYAGASSRIRSAAEQHGVATDARPTRRSHARRDDARGALPQHRPRRRRARGRRDPAARAGAG